LVRLILDWLVNNFCNVAINCQHVKYFQNSLHQGCQAHLVLWAILVHLDFTQARHFLAK